MKGVVFTTDEKMFVKEFTQPLYKSVGDVVGGWIEVVYPRGLEQPYCFICNEEGLLRGLPLNPIGCVWYRTAEHGNPIVGNIVVMKEGITEEGPDIIGLMPEEIEKIKAMALEISNGLIVDLDAQEALKQNQEIPDEKCVGCALRWLQEVEA